MKAWTLNFVWFFFGMLLALPTRSQQTTLYTDVLDSIGFEHPSLTHESFFVGEDSLVGGQFEFRPWVTAAGGYQGDSSVVRSYALAGGMLSYMPHRKWRLKLGGLIGGYSNGVMFGSDSLQTTPFLGIARPVEDLGKISDRISSELSFSPSKYFSLSVGHGSHHWGSGYRSLWLSEVSPAYSYGRIDSHFWHLRYTNLYMKLADTSFGQTYSNHRSKYASLHTLSWQVGKRFNISLFEAVIWQATDSLSDRQFEFNYLNPVIFYRPIEFSQGSADNVLIGLGWEWNVDDKIVPYGQALIDEFLLAELRARNGWWANKFGGQLGIKWKGLPNHKWSGQVEGNFTRPFTYTHGSQIQAYGHLNQPLAHPLGSNYYEALMRLRYEAERWSLRGSLVISSYGRDPADQNLGGNVFRSYAAPFKEFENTITQGTKTNLYQAQASAHYHLQKMGDAAIFGKAGVRHTASEGVLDTKPWVEIGFRMGVDLIGVDF